MSEIKLETKLVGEISGKFLVPSYQRGYRWSREEVSRLLDDIYANGIKNYCLQPIVVRRTTEGAYELIDGQQRLTTIYLIYRYMYNSSGGFLGESNFSISYDTREKSAEFLKETDLTQKENNIDFWFMSEAYEVIEEWFSSRKKSTLTNINKYFDENVKVIWYEVGADEDAISLFTRLNIGKIPLTSAELVKAMFLSRDCNENMSTERQEEIALQWDIMEKELHDRSLWNFLTNSADKRMQTRIDLILNLIARRPKYTREKYYTFFVFDRLKEERPLHEIWSQIYHTWLLLRDWYEDHTLYHKIGYLIASSFMTLQEIFILSGGKGKREFQERLDSQIRKSIDIDKNYGELSYDKQPDHLKIARLLLLFNIESVRQLDGGTQRFPFDQFKADNIWSLEHIHAQQSEGMRKQEDWKEWLRLHIPSVHAVGGTDELIAEMEHAREQEVLERSLFESVQAKVIETLSADGNVEYLHSISNLALLNTSDNAALNNSTFDVKRNIIIEMDKAGKYIPFCTKMVFLKYYSPSEGNQLHFWGASDREAYIGEMNRVLKKYLREPILTGRGRM